MKPLTIDAFDFARLKEQRGGDIAVADLPRLKAECAQPDGVLHWSMAGDMHPAGHPQLTLEVRGDVTLVCQRCLQPFAFGIASHSVLVLAQDEAHADHVEAALDDESLDVIAGSRAMNLTELVEDEALLAIPQAPKHDRCPGAADTAPEAGIVVKPSPFAVLKNLKH